MAVADRITQYVCKQCGTPCRKDPLKALKDWRTAKPEDFGGLGKWRCPRCGKTKVKRKKRSDPE